MATVICLRMAAHVSVLNHVLELEPKLEIDSYLAKGPWLHFQCKTTQIGVREKGADY